MVNTLTNVSGARSAPAQPADNLSTPASGHAASRPTPAPAAALADDRLASQDAVESGPENHPSLDALGRLNVVLQDPKAASAFVELVKALEQQGGLSPAGFRCARIGVSCQQDRREQVLADLRKMQARTDLKPKMIQNNMCAILAQHIGLIIGLGLEPDGRRRAVPSKDDYAAVGALVRAYGPERVWLTVCDVAGARIGGDPLDYLRAALSKDSRPAAPAKRAPGTGDFNELDYLKYQTATQEDK